MTLSVFIVAALITLAATESELPVNKIPLCNECKGDAGEKGLKGKRGATGVEGEPGAPGEMYFRGDDIGCGSKLCPIGAPGNNGSFGKPGQKGEQGIPGDTGKRGDSGDVGSPGQPGPPGSYDGDVMYLPYKPGKEAGQVCYTFRKVCAGKILKYPVRSKN